jgi:hypothetical protein
MRDDTLACPNARAPTCTTPPPRAVHRCALLLQTPTALPLSMPVLLPWLSESPRLPSRSYLFSSPADASPHLSHPLIGSTSFFKEMLIQLLLKMLVNFFYKNVSSIFFKKLLTTFLKEYCNVF